MRTGITTVSDMGWCPQAAKAFQDCGDGLTTAATLQSPTPAGAQYGSGPSATDTSTTGQGPGHMTPQAALGRIVAHLGGRPIDEARRNDFDT
jgi:hypothetical protein